MTNYKIPIPSGTIYRINLAWINDLDELEKLLKKHQKHEIFLDLPVRRTKPPLNSYNLKEIIPFINNFSSSFLSTYLLIFFEYEIICKLFFL